MSINEVREDVRRLEFYQNRADWNQITNRPSLFPPAAHTHVMADITDLSVVAGNGSIGFDDNLGVFVMDEGTP